MANQYELDAWVSGLPDMIKNPQPSQFDDLVNQMKQSGEAGNTAYVNTKRNWFTDGVDAVKRWATQPTPSIKEVGVIGGNPLDMAMGKNKNFQLSEKADNQMIENVLQKARDAGRAVKRAVVDWTSPHPGLGAEQGTVPLEQGTESIRALNSPDTRPTIGDIDRQNKGMPPRYLGTGEYKGDPNNPNPGYPDPQARQFGNTEGDPELRGLSDNQLEDLAKSLVAGTGQAQPGGIFDRVIKEKSRRSARAGQQPYENYRGLDRLQSSGGYNQIKAQQSGIERMRDAIGRSWAENEQLNKEGASLQMMGNTIGR